MRVHNNGQNHMTKVCVNFSFMYADYEWTRDGRQSAVVYGTDYKTEAATHIRTILTGISCCVWNESPEGTHSRTIREERRQSERRGYKTEENEDT